MSRTAAKVLAGTFGVLLALGLAACGSTTAGGETTCNEWLAIDLSTEEAFGNLADGESNLSDEQQDILKDALDEEGLSTDELNMANASLNVIQFCAPDGTGTRPNAEQPIRGALQ